MKELVPKLIGLVIRATDTPMKKVIFSFKKGIFCCSLRNLCIFNKKENGKYKEDS